MDDDDDSSAGAPRVVEPSVAEVTTRLDDQIDDLPGDRIAWSTTWTMCWAAYPEARAYELEVVTGEGTAPTLDRQPEGERCKSIEAAAGENARSEGLANRELVLSTTAGQLGYRVRAMLDDDTVSAWSPLYPVGETGET
jgi:hypothetical protein